MSKTNTFPIHGDSDLIVNSLLFDSGLFSLRLIGSSVSHNSRLDFGLRSIRTLTNDSSYPCRDRGVTLHEDVVVVSRLMCIQMGVDRPIGVGPLDRNLRST